MVVFNADRCTRKEHVSSISHENSRANFLLVHLLAFCKKNILFAIVQNILDYKRTASKIFHSFRLTHNH